MSQASSHRSPTTHFLRAHGHHQGQSPPWKGWGNFLKSTENNICCKKMLGFQMFCTLNKFTFESPGLMHFQDSYKLMTSCQWHQWHIEPWSPEQRRQPGNPSPETTGPQQVVTGGQRRSIKDDRGSTQLLLQTCVQTLRPWLCSKRWEGVRISPQFLLVTPDSTGFRTKMFTIPSRMCTYLFSEFLHRTWEDLPPWDQRILIIVDPNGFLGS